jgi:mRNA interferase MazF
VTRGDLVTVAIAGDYGTPRPALVIQSDLFDLHPSVTVMPVTSDLRDAPLFRILVEAGATTGLERPSQLMVDKILTVPRDKVGRVIGRLQDEAMVAVNRSLAVFLGLA